jgi:CheY-like chemotaxis protein
LPAVSAHAAESLETYPYDPGNGSLKKAVQAVGATANPGLVLFEPDVAGTSLSAAPPWPTASGRAARMQRSTPESAFTRASGRKKHTRMPTGEEKMRGAEDCLKGKRLLVVDDEPEILETLLEMLDMCSIDTASDFEAASAFLNKKKYDAAIFDIMEVQGYDLLNVAIGKGIPALMLTAHALSPENLKHSIRSGASAYIPKEKIHDIEDYVAELIQSARAGKKHAGGWFSRLRPVFDKEFGRGWQEKDKEFWEEFESRRLKAMNYTMKSGMF